MQILANEVKKGMTIGWGVVTLTVNEIVKGKQKNGKETRTFIGSAARSMGRGHKPRVFNEYDFTCKSLTKLDLR